MNRRLRLTAERERLGLSKDETARRAGLNAATISQAESGRFRPYDSQLLKLLDVFGLEGDPKQLLEEVDDR